MFYYYHYYLTCNEYIIPTGLISKDLLSKFSTIKIYLELGIILEGSDKTALGILINELNYDDRIILP